MRTVALLIAITAVVAPSEPAHAKGKHEAKRKQIKKQIEGKVAEVAKLLVNVQAKRQCQSAATSQSQAKKPGKRPNARIRKVRKRRFTRLRGAPFCTEPFEKLRLAIVDLKNDLDRHIESDNDAGEIVSNYPNKARDIHSRAQDLEKLLAMQHEAKDFPQRCKDDEKRLLDGMRTEAEKGDLDAYRAARKRLVDRARDTKSEISEINRHEVEIASRKRNIGTFKYKQRGWNSVHKNLHASADAIIKKWREHQKKMNETCKEFRRGSSHKDVPEIESTLTKNIADNYEKRVKEWVKKRKKLFKHDCDKIKELHQAYCKDVDAEQNGYAWVREADAKAEAMKKDVSERAQVLLDAAKQIREDGRKLALQPELKRNADDRKRIRGARVNSSQYKTWWKIRAITDVKRNALRGAQRPSVRLWLQHGKNMHKKMERESKYRCDLRDQPFDVIDPNRTTRAGNPVKVRPDCVSASLCKIFEFKPKGGAEFARGKAQVKEYKAILEKHYNEWLTSKQNGPGGQRFMKKLRKNCLQNDAIKFKTKVATYNPCKFEYKCHSDAE